MWIFFSIFFSTEFLQPQHIWPYLQHNFIHHHSQLHNQGFHVNNNHQPQPQQQHIQPPHHPHAPSPISNNNNDADNLQQLNNNSNNNNNSNHSNNNTNNNSNGSNLDNGGAAFASDAQDADNRLQSRDKQQLIAKPLASRPAPPFLHHTLNHPHLHSLLAHCRNPYIAGGELFFFFFFRQTSSVATFDAELNSFVISSFLHGA